MPTKDRVTIGSPRVLIPGAASEPVTDVLAANNNLDACDHDGRRYLAWRTAPTHFASSEAMIHVVSTTDGESWRFETTVALACDVREPRFFVFKGELFLYFFTLGVDWRRFEAGAIHVTRLIDGTWTTPVAISDGDCVVWRVRQLDGVPVMTMYRGSTEMYSNDPVVTTVEFWTTDDGLAWRPLSPTNPTAHVGGTETEVVPGPGGGWIAVTRKEGPHDFGSDIAYLENLAGPWRIRSYPQKLDSPYLFRSGDDVLLIARRTTSFHGDFDLGLNELSLKRRTAILRLVYWATSKRTTLWRIDPDSLALERVVDLPGKGDTCFPAVVDEGNGHFRVYNYTSPLDGMDVPWVAGQLAPTQIYEVDLHVAPPA